MPLDNLQMATHFSSSMKLIKDEDVQHHGQLLSALAGTSSGIIFSMLEIKQQYTGGKCICGRMTHKMGVWGFIMGAGFMVEHDLDKAKAKWECNNQDKCGKVGSKPSASSPVSSPAAPGPP